jgi:AraC-like DNA-binding protein
MRPRKNTREERFNLMRERQARPHIPVLEERPATAVTNEPTFNLAQVARQLGVSYSTARRLVQYEPGVRRYSTTTAGTSPVFPGTALRRCQRVRMSFVIPESVVVRLRQKMCGVAA